MSLRAAAEPPERDHCIGGDSQRALRYAHAARQLIQSARAWREVVEQPDVSG